MVQLPALFLASLLLIGGSIGDHFGLKKALAAGLAVFAVSSAGCALAPDIRVLLVFRAVLGIGGAVLVPASFSMISYFFEPKERGKAIGIWSGATGLTVVIGQVLGGALTTFVSWRAIFFLPIPLAAVVFERMRKIPPAPPVSRERQGGLLEASFMFVFLASAVFVFIELPGRGILDGNVMVSAAIMILAGGVFRVLLKNGTSHVVPPYTYRIPSLAGANVITFVLYVAFTGSLFFLPLNLVQIQEFTELQAGLSLSPFVLTIFLLSRTGGLLTDRKGPMLPAMAGSFLVAVAFVLFARTGVRLDYIHDLLLPIILMGSGLAFVAPALSTTVMNSVDREHLGAAAGLNTTVSRVAGLAGLAFMGMLMTFSFRQAFSANLFLAGVNDPLFQELVSKAGMLGGISVPEGISPDLAQAIVGSRNIAFLYGFGIICVLAAMLSLLSCWLAFIFFRNYGKTAGF